MLIATFTWAFAAVAVVELHDMGLGSWLSTAVLAVVSVGIATMVQFGIVGPLRRHAALQEARRRRAEALAEASRGDLDLVDSTDRALEVATTEGEVLEVLRRVSVAAAPGLDCQLLLCDSDGHYSHAVALRAEGFGPPDPTRGDPRAVSDHEATSARVPMRTAVIEVGMVHVASTDGEEPSGAALRRVERASRRCAARIVELRAAREAAMTQQRGEVPSPLELGSEVDRATVERVAHQLIARLERFALALVCVDRALDPLDDVDPAWQNATRDLLGDVLDETLRPTDVIGRTERTFMLLLPEADAISALAALERVRENLVLRLAELGARPFTASIGVASSTDATDLQALTLSADLALRMAQRQGGNRVRAWDAEAHSDQGTESTRD